MAVLYLVPVIHTSGIELRCRISRESLHLP